MACRRRSSPLVVTVIAAFSFVNADVWKQEVGSQMAIGETNSGYKRVELRCGANYMEVSLETEEDFSGVIYTRGSFHKREPPCYLDPAQGRNFSLRFALDQCNTKHDEDTYSNVVVLQHDDELIMPGDAAFTLECDFSRPRDVTVSADLAAKSAVSSRISLADADPAGKELPRHRRSTVTSTSQSVAFTPEDVRPRTRHS
ncbi:uncharacterized protein [Anabrus simplex]|uniref:uncharacterized protein isoform X2 n=1 Tax=Anabrus simplex TaxID=316456 RepID=UPI0035A3981C